MKETCERVKGDDKPSEICGAPAVMTLGGMFYCQYHGEYQIRVKKQSNSGKKRGSKAKSKSSEGD
jgi:hypothetical protein